MTEYFSLLVALVQVVLIDLVMSADNAIAVGLSVAGLPPENRKKAIFIGLSLAVLFRILFASVVIHLLSMQGLILGGGLLLLWVVWKLWKELRHTERTSTLSHSLSGNKKTFKQSVFQIVMADISMSLDNVLAVGGAAREHPVILVGGLILSIFFMAVASNFVAKTLHKHRAIGYVGLLVVLYVAIHMIWQGILQLT